MAKFHGDVGYAESIEISPGVWKKRIIRKTYYGDVLRAVRKLEEGESINDDVIINNTISIVADAYAKEHFFAIRFVEWMGVLWTVKNAEVQSPRLILTLGGVYNGPKT